MGSRPYDVLGLVYPENHPGHPRWQAFPKIPASTTLSTTLPGSVTVRSPGISRGTDVGTVCPVAVRGGAFLPSLQLETPKYRGGSWPPAVTSTNPVATWMIALVT